MNSFSGHAFLPASLRFLIEIIVFQALVVATVNLITGLGPGYSKLVGEYSPSVIRTLVDL